MYIYIYTSLEFFRCFITIFLKCAMGHTRSVQRWEASQVTTKDVAAAINAFAQNSAWTFVHSVTASC